MPEGKIGIKEYRHKRIKPRTHNLASILSIDSAAYAVMNNHYYIVHYIEKEKALNWPNNEVAPH
ncbi:hypothetical protein GL2_02570 [Microbulbifer sp. GL-2]|nr:hypothetical protein GL2_02570 [Microbulbifer sp. GL-2]